MSRRTDDRPNVVLVTCHDLGRHLGCYGAGVETPHVDEMAAGGVLFENYFCTAPQCSPSRGSVATGKYPHRNGLMGLVHRGWSLDDEEIALPERLAEAGYATHLVGFQHEHDWGRPERLGYQHVHNETSAPDEHGRALDVADRFAAVLEGMDGGGDEPFFASLGFVEPHRPFRREWVPESAYDRYDPDEVDLPQFLEDDPETREDVADLNSLVSATTDPAVGRVREALREADVADDTVVIFTTDHGLPFERAKTTGYDAGVNVAFLIEAPGRFGAGESRTEPIVNADLFPTVLDLAGASIPDDIDGRSFLPLLDGGSYDPRDRLYFEQTWHVSLQPFRAVRTDRYKYIRNFRPNVTGPGTEDPPAEELYDLDADPEERTNLVDPAGDPIAGATPEHAEALADLRTSLRRWMVETGDPLADGCIPMPDHERAWFDDEG